MVSASWLILISLPLVSAAIGWGTNKLAIHLLFRPRQPIRILGIRCHGLIPRRHSAIAATTADIVQRELLTRHVLRAQVEKIDLGPLIDEYARKLVQERLSKRLKSVPFIGNLLNPALLAQLEGIAREEMRKEAGPLLMRFADQAEEHMDIRALVQERVEAFELDQLEAVVRRLAGQEFRTIEILGGVLGFLIGLVQVGLLLLTR